MEDKRAINSKKKWDRETRQLENNGYKPVYEKCKHGVKILGWKSPKGKVNTRQESLNLIKKKL